MCRQEANTPPERTLWLLRHTTYTHTLSTPHIVTGDCVCNHSSPTLLDFPVLAFSNSMIYIYKQITYSPYIFKRQETKLILILTQLTSLESQSCNDFCNINYYTTQQIGVGWMIVFTRLLDCGWRRNSSPIRCPPFTHTHTALLTQKCNATHNIYTTNTPTCCRNRINWLKVEERDMFYIYFLVGGAIFLNILR